MATKPTAPRASSRSKATTAATRTTAIAATRSATPPNDGAAAVEAHLASLPEPQQSTLRALRATLRKVLPEAEEGIKYRMPSFIVDGIGVAAYDGFTKHCSYFPFSGNVVGKVDVPAWCDADRGTLRFPIDRPPGITLVRKLVKVRQAEIAEKQAARRPRR